jgi:hypothetical protein
MDEMNEISDVISRGFAAAQSQESQDQLEAELHELMAQAEAETGSAQHPESKNNQAGVSAVRDGNILPNLPSVPSTQTQQGNVGETRRTEAKLAGAV